MKFIINYFQHIFEYKKRVAKLVLIFFSILVNSAFAQNIEFTKDNFKDNKDKLKEAKSNIDKGDKFYEQGTVYYKQALEPYLMANNFNPENALLNFKIGNCYLYSNNKLKSIPFLEKALKLDIHVDPQIHYSLARAYHLDMQWDKAVSEYKTYQGSLTNSTENKTIYEDVLKKIQECNNGKTLAAKPVRVFIDNVGDGVNSAFSDYCPLITADESTMIFTSRRVSTTGGGKDEFLNDYFEDIYVSTKVNNKWTDAKNIGPPINTKRHDAAMGLSPDGQILYVYVDERGDGNIYESTLEGAVWSKPEKLNKNINTDSHESSASLSGDIKTLYFVSDRADGMGGRDIWTSTKDENDKWGKAVNIGPTINTTFDEEGVFIHPDGKTIYFSSKGHNTMGGYDIFKSVFENGNWQEPENIGYPINTPDDDVFFVMAANGRHGYYSSFNSNGFGEKDIYRVTFLGPEKQMILNNEDNLLASALTAVKENVTAPAVKIAEAQLTLLKGIITDDLSKTPLGATIEIADIQKNQQIASFVSNSSSGKYIVSLPSGKNYGITVRKDGYLFHSENIDIPASADYQEVKKDIALKSLAAGNKIVLNNIFFSSDKATLRSESTNELQRIVKLLKENSSMKVEISGHTDSKGAAEYNQTLSENRAKAVVDYIIAAGIKPARLTYKGYGKDQPIATNDTEEGRQLNRRTEFKIISK